MTNFKQIMVLCICLSLFSAENCMAFNDERTQAKANHTACKLHAPPAGSSVLDVHGLRLLTFPATIGPTYTGCQKTWFGEGSLFLSLRYRSGRLSQANYFEPGEKEVICTYHRGQLKSGAEEVCTRIARDNKIPGR